MAEKLKKEEGCKIIIALTHMRVRHDLKFAEEVPGIDFVLAGHDHFYKLQAVGQKIKQEDQKQAEKEKIVPLVKSGSDFHDFTEINITFEFDKSEYAEIAEDLEEEDYEASFQRMVFTKKQENEDMSMLMYSDAD